MGTPMQPAGLQTLVWQGGTDGCLVVVDQTRLPGELVMRECRDVDTVWEAIRQLRVRGAPAIGIAAAYGVVLAAGSAADDPPQICEAARQAARHLATSRPTAVNLFWALERMSDLVAGLADQPDGSGIRQRLLDEAIAIHEEDRTMCHRIGRHGAELLGDKLEGVLTHCNAGGLATSEYGTALSVFFTAHDLGLPVHVFIDETRPLLQGSRLTAWELQQHRIPATLICDSMAAQIMKEGRVRAVVTGADRIAANGDTANKIGTYSVAVLARHHDIPFYVAAPGSTFDLSLPDGERIPIEQREADEITDGFGRRTAPQGMDVYNPAFDVTPARLIRAIITERGVIDPVDQPNIARHFCQDTP